MTIKYNVTGARRKALVQAIGEILGEDAVYNGAPTFSYTVDNFSIDRNGTVSCPYRADAPIVANLIADLKDRGFETSGDACDDGNKLTIEMPRTHISLGAIENLKKIVESKETLFKKAFQTDSVPIVLDEQTLKFPWFSLTGADDEAYVYSQFITALCEMAKRQKRVTAKEKQSNNDKFDMRVFPIRLGFVGDKYKKTRKILLQNLTGNTAFKSGTQGDVP